MFEIADVMAMEILDSRGNPTLKTIVRTKGGYGFFCVPSGASKGKREALELRDGGRRFLGRGVLQAVHNVNTKIKKLVLGKDSRRQAEIDYQMIRADGTPNKSRYGANAILSVSGAVARAAADTSDLELYEYLGGVGKVVLPVPFMNIINGGLHAGNELNIQEFMIVPAKFDTFRDALTAAVEVYQTLKTLLKENFGKNSVNLGDEGGFSPPMRETREALSFLEKAIEKAGYSDSVYMALDSAASNFYDVSEEVYRLDGKILSSGELLEFYIELVNEFPIISLEDPFHEDDFESFAEMTKRIGEDVQIVGDDIFTTNMDRFKEGLRVRAANTLLVKPNQIGTITETMEVSRFAQSNGYRIMISHRSGETTDSFIADLSVGLRSGEIKAGAPARGERVAKYNRLLEIELTRPDSEYFGEKVLQRGTS